MNSSPGITGIVDSASDRSQGTGSGYGSVIHWVLVVSSILHVVYEWISYLIPQGYKLESIRIGYGITD